MKCAKPLYRRTVRVLSHFVDHPVRRGIVVGGTAALGALFEAISISLAVRSMFSAAVKRSDTFVFWGRSFSFEFVILTALVCSICTIAFHVVNARAVSQLVADVGESVRVRSYEAFASASWASQAQQREGSLQHTMTSVSSGVATLSRATVFFFATVATLFIFVCAALLIQPIATMAFVFIGTITLGILRPLSRRARRASEAHVRTERGFADVVSQVSESAMESKVFGVQGRVATILRQRAQLLAEASARYRFAIEINTYLYKDLAILFLIFVVAGSYIVGASSFASITVVLALLLRAISSAQQSNALYQTIIEYAPYAQLAEESIEALGNATLTFGDEHLENFTSMSLIDVSYTYEHAVTPAIDGINLTLRKGEVVGLAGPSGAGKSTIAQIILRLRLPSTGRVEVDGRNYTRISEEQWAQAVAFVPQEPSLIYGTIRENIAYYRSIDDAAVLRAARLANIHDVICQLPGGYDAELGPRGTGLSGGQKQRLAIARALAAHPTVLVLDEPTSALDAGSEAAVVSSIEALRQECAVLVVTHRASTEAICDRILRI